MQHIENARTEAAWCGAPLRKSRIVIAQPEVNFILGYRGIAPDQDLPTNACWKCKAIANEVYRLTAPAAIALENAVHDYRTRKEAVA